MHPSNILEDAPRIVAIDYIDRRGERRRYEIIPHAIRFGREFAHTDPQWLMDATNVQTKVVATFVVANIRNWGRPS